MPEPAGSGAVRQQIGEILGTVRSLSEQIKDIRDTALRQETKVNAEMANSKQEARQEAQIITSRLELLAAQVADLERSLASLIDDVGAVRGPVAQLVELRSRLTFWTLGAVSIITVVWYVLVPLLHPLLDRIATVLFAGGHS